MALINGNPFMYSGTSLARFTIRSLLPLAALAGLAGCTAYQTKPLEPAAVESGLVNPGFEAIRISAANFHHPLLAPLAIDGRAGFTPDELALMSVIASPRLRAVRDQRGVAAAQVVQAGLLPNPQLGYSLDKLGPNSDSGLISGLTYGLSWEVTALLGYRDRVAAARSTATALDLAIAWEEWQTAQATRLAAFRVISLEARLPLARDTETELTQALAESRKAYSLGYRTISDLAATTEAWSLAQDAHFALERELTTQRLTLNLALGRPAGEEIKLLTDTPWPQLPPGLDNAAGLLEGFEKKRLDLVALTLGYESAEATLRAAVKAQFPKIGLSLARARDTSDVHTVTYGVTVDLPLFDRNQGQIAASSATRQQLFDEYVARVAEARAEVSQILASLSIARAQLQTLQAELPDLEQIATALTKAMASRNADLQAWRDARGTLLARRTEAAKMRQDVLDLGVALELAIGRPLLTAPSPSRP
jgi:outer membrane protein TolC